MNMSGGNPWTGYQDSDGLPLWHNAISNEWTYDPMVAGYGGGGSGMYGGGMAGGYGQQGYGMTGMMGGGMGMADMNGVYPGNPGGMLGPPGGAPWPMMPQGPFGQQVMGPNGPLMVPNGPMMGPAGPMIGPPGPMMGPNGPMMGPMMGPNGPMMQGPNGPMMQGQQPHGQNQSRGFFSGTNPLLAGGALLASALGGAGLLHVAQAHDQGKQNQQGQQTQTVQGQPMTIQGQQGQPTTIQGQQPAIAFYPGQQQVVYPGQIAGQAFTIPAQPQAAVVMPGLVGVAAAAASPQNNTGAGKKEGKKAGKDNKKNNPSSPPKEAAAPVAVQPQTIPVVVQTRGGGTAQLQVPVAQSPAESSAPEEPIGLWERYYDGDGGKFWRNTVTGDRLTYDPYK